MAARHEQQQIGEGEVGIGQPRAERMAFEVIDRHQRLARRMRQRLAGDEPHHHPADQPRSGGRRHRVDIRQRDAGIRQRRFDQRLQRLDMRARGDFRDDAAIRPVGAFLPGKPVCQHLPIGGDECGSGFVAGGFEAENEHRLSLSARPHLVEGRPRADRTRL